MRLGASRRHQFFAYLHRKRQIREAIAVQMADFASTDAELDSTETVRSHDDAVPTRDFAFDLFGEAVGHTGPHQRVISASRSAPTETNLTGTRMRSSIVST